MLYMVYSQTCDVVFAEALLCSPLHRFLREVDGQVSGVLVLVVQTHLADQLFVYHIPDPVAGKHKPGKVEYIIDTFVNSLDVATYVSAYIYIHTWRAGWRAR